MMSVETLNAWGSGWSTFMVRALIDSSVLLAVVLLVWLPLRRRMSAQFAHGLFLLVLLKLAVPFPASWPTWSVDAPLKRVASGVSAWAIADGPAAPPARPRSRPTDDPIVVASVPEPIVAAAVSIPAPKSQVVPEAPRAAIAPAKARTTLSTPAILMLAWTPVSAALLARFARSVWATRRLIRESLPIPDGSGWFPVDFEALRRTAGVRSEVRWAVSAKVTSPAVGGLIRPTVVMPPDFDEGLTTKQLNWVLLHELAHIRRGDLWVVTVQRLLGAVFFFHPAVHIANWIIDQLREYACDDAALAAAHASRHACGEGFLTIVGRTVDHASTPAPALGLFESRMLIHRRLLRILDSRRTIHERLSPLATLSLVAMALVVLPYGHPRDAAADLSTAGPAGRPTPRPAAGGAPPLRLGGDVPPRRPGQLGRQAALARPGRGVFAQRSRPGHGRRGFGHRDPRRRHRCGPRPARRPRRRRDLPGLQPRRLDPRLGRLRQDGPALGRVDRTTPGHPRGPRPVDLRPRLQPRRQVDRLGRLRQDRPALGRRLHPDESHARRPDLGHPGARLQPRRQATGLGRGRPRRDALVPRRPWPVGDPVEGTGGRSGRSPSAPTASRSRPPGRTARSSSGTRGPGSSGPR